jgi:broad specificity phosphatase PhoE
MSSTTKKALLAVAGVLIPSIGLLYLGVTYCTTFPTNNASGHIDNAPGNPPAGATEEFLLRVYVVRHAEAYKNIPCPPGTSPEKLDSLTPRGREQATAAGEALKDKSIVAVIASPTGRTRETAKLISDAVGLTAAPTLDAAFRSLGAGESQEDGAARAIKAITDLADQYRGRAVVVVSHGDICPALLGHAAKTSMPARRELHSVQTGSVSPIEITSSGWRIIGPGESPPEI